MRTRLRSFKLFNIYAEIKTSQQMTNLKQNDLLEIAFASVSYVLFPVLLMFLASVAPLFLILGVFFPLPIYIITLKKGHIAGLLAVGFSFFLSLVTGLNFSLLLMGFPIIFFCHKALKSRQGLDNRLEWYPLSLLLQWSAIFAIGISVLISAVLYLVLSPEPQVFLETLIHHNPSLKGKITLESITTLYSYAPGIFACYWVAIQFLNGYLAQLFLEKTKKNIRPMPAILNLTVKNYWYYAFAACLALTLIFSNEYDHIFQNLALCLMIPIFFTGLSVVHHAVQMADDRLKPFIFVFYVLFFLLPTLSLIIVALGIVEPRVGLRKKLDARRKK